MEHKLSENFHGEAAPAPDATPAPPPTAPPVAPPPAGPGGEQGSSSWVTAEHQGCMSNITTKRHPKPQNMDHNY